jgi:hypothetical protein
MELAVDGNLTFAGVEQMSRELITPIPLAEYAGTLEHFDVRCHVTTNSGA